MLTIQVSSNCCRPRSEAIAGRAMFKLLLANITPRSVRQSAPRVHQRRAYTLGSMPSKSTSSVGTGRFFFDTNKLRTVRFSLFIDLVRLDRWLSQAETQLNYYRDMMPFSQFLRLTKLQCLPQISTC